MLRGRCPDRRCRARLLVPLGRLQRRLSRRGGRLARLPAAAGVGGASVRTGGVLTGLLQGVFHLPLYLLSDSYMVAGSRWIVVPLAMVAFTFGGVFYAWLRRTFDSIWPVAVGPQRLQRVRRGAWLVDGCDLPGRARLCHERDRRGDRRIHRPVHVVHPGSSVRVSRRAPAGPARIRACPIHGPRTLIVSPGREAAGSRIGWPDPGRWAGWRPCDGASRTRRPT